MDFIKKIIPLYFKHHTVERNTETKEFTTNLGTSRENTNSDIYTNATNNMNVQAIEDENKQTKVINNSISLEQNDTLQHKIPVDDSITLKNVDNSDPNNNTSKDLDENTIKELKEFENILNRKSLELSRSNDLNLDEINSILNIDVETNKIEPLTNFDKEKVGVCDEDLNEINEIINEHYDYNKVTEIETNGTNSNLKTMQELSSNNDYLNLVKIKDLVTINDEDKEWTRPDTNVIKIFNGINSIDGICENLPPNTVHIESTTSQNHYLSLVETNDLVSINDENKELIRIDTNVMENFNVINSTENNCEDLTQNTEKIESSTSNNNNISLITISDVDDDNTPLIYLKKDTDIISISSTEASDCSGYYSSDFEFITESEAHLDGFIINFSSKNVDCTDPVEGPSNKFKRDKSYRDNHIIPEGDGYFDLFRGIYDPRIQEIHFLENKSIRTSIMNVQYDGIGFDKQLVGRYIPDSSDEEFGDEAKETAKKISSMYPHENRKRRRRR